MGRKTGLIVASVLGLGLGGVYAEQSIVGGHSVSITVAPWQLLFYPSGAMCGAILINDSTAISAAHCVDGAQASSSYVHAGITTTKQATNATRIGIKQIIAYPNWDLSHDISILKLATKVTATLAKPIRYATAADATAGLTAPGKACMATGWGGIDRNVKFPDSLQMVMSVIYNSNQTGVIQWAGQGGTANIGSCQGDSGGPLVVHDASGVGWIAAGISSYIQSYCGDPTKPASYSRISTFATWLQQNGVNQPATTAINGPDIAPPLFSNGRLTLGQSQNVIVTVTNLSGGVVAKTRRFYPAGEHAMPTANLAAGGYVLRIQGDHIDFRSSIRK